jgi:transcriptional regulator with XRE-family HTH domain
MTRWARKRAGMTQHELARALEMPQPSIARIESGQVTPRVDTFLAILGATHQAIALEQDGPEPDREAIRDRLAIPMAMRQRAAFGRRATVNYRTSPVQMLRALRRFNVPFVLIGDLAEVVHGAPLRLARTIDVCAAQTQEAMDRLAHARDRLERMPKVGKLNVVAMTRAGDDYDALRRNAVNALVAPGIKVHVAALEDLIRDRRAGGTPDDVAAMSTLRTIGDEAT